MSVSLGQCAFNFAIKMSAGHAPAVEALIASHAKSMQANNSLDNSKTPLAHY